MNYSSNDTVELLGRRVEVLEKQLIALRNPWLCPICGHVMTEMESKGYKGCPDCFHAAQHVRPVDLIAELVVLKEQLTALELSNRNLIMELAACQQKLDAAERQAENYRVGMVNTAQTALNLTQRAETAERALQIMVDDGECYCTDNVASKEPCGWCNAKGLLCRK